MALFDVDLNLLDSISSRMRLRDPNRRALRAVVANIASGAIGADELTLRMATGTGKTYVMRALIEYAATKGVRHIMVVVPGRVVRAKTIGNLTSGAEGFISGGEASYTLITPGNFETQQAASALVEPNRTCVLLLNIDLLNAKDSDTAKSGAAAASRRTNRVNEFLGSPLYDHLRDADDLLIITDESHLYNSPSYSKSLASLGAAARVGLSATPAEKAQVIFDYSLRQAVADQFVKTPIIAARSEGYSGGTVTVERDKLADGLGVLKYKTGRYRLHEQVTRGARRANPIMLVACGDIDHATQVSTLLRSSSFLGSADAVLQVDSANMTDADEAALAAVQAEDSPVRVVVNVNMLNAGWDVANVAVLVPLRALSSTTLTEQMIGRGLRLPYGAYTGDPVVDSLDIIGHTSMFEALRRAGIEPAPKSQPPSPTAAERADADPGASGGVPSQTGMPQGAASLDATVPLAGGAKTGDDLLDTATQLGGGVRDLGEQGKRLEEEHVAPVSITQVRGGSFACPTLTRRVASVMFDLDTIKTANLKEAAERVGTDFSETIDREQLYTRARADQLNIEAPSLEESSVRSSLTRTVVQAAMVMPSPETTSHAADIAREFISLCPAGGWNGQRLASAMYELRTAVARLRKEAELKKTVELVLGSVTMPTSHGSLVEKLLEERSVSDARQFQRHAPYEGWQRGMFNAARFDAFDTEMMIARLVDKSPTVDWWVRVYGTDNVRIQYPGGEYIPDFVICEGSDLWVVEGKWDSGKTDPTVTAKKDATETMLRKMRRDHRWNDQTWRYLLAYESDVALVHSWDNLKAKAVTVVVAG